MRPYERGDLVWYRQRDGSLTEAKVYDHETARIAHSILSVVHNSTVLKAEQVHMNNECLTTKP